MDSMLTKFIDSIKGLNKEYLERQSMDQKEYQQARRMCFHHCELV